MTIPIISYWIDSDSSDASIASPAAGGDSIFNGTSRTEFDYPDAAWPMPAGMPYGLSLCDEDYEGIPVMSLDLTDEDDFVFTPYDGDVGLDDGSVEPDRELMSNQGVKRLFFFLFSLGMVCSLYYMAPKP